MDYIISHSLACNIKIHIRVLKWFSFLIKGEGEFPNFPFHSQPKKKARVNKKFPGLRVPTQYRLIMQMSKVSGWVKSFVTKTHYSQMKNLYCQRNICKAQHRWRVYKGSELWCTTTELRTLHTQTRAHSLHLLCSTSWCQKVRLIMSGCKMVHSV